MTKAWNNSTDEQSVRTFIERLGQLCPHTPLKRGLGAQREGYKQRRVRRFGSWAVGRNFSAANYRSSLMLSESHTTTACCDAGRLGINVALKTGQNVHTAVYRHFDNVLNYACFIFTAPFGIFKCRTHHKPQQRTVNTHLFLIKQRGKGPLRPHICLKENCGAKIDFNVSKIETFYFPL